MRTLRRPGRAPARWLLAGALALAACRAPAPAPAGVPTRGADHVLRVAVCSRARPFAYRLGGRLRGFDVELLEAIAARLRVGLRWADDCGTVVSEVAGGGADVGAAELAIGTDLPGGAAFSDPYYVPTLGLTVAPAATPGLRTLEGLSRGDLVGVREGSAARWATVALSTKGIRLKRFPSAAALFGALAAGELTAAIDDEPVSWAEIENRPTLRVVQSIDTGLRYGFVVNDAEPGSPAAVNGALQAVIADGTYTRVFAKYFPGTTLPIMFRST